MRIKLCLILLFSTYITFAQQINIVPQPKSIKKPTVAGSFSINAATVLVLESSNMNNAVNFFNNYLQRFYNIKLKVVKNSASKNIIRLNFGRINNEAAGAYNLTVDNKGIYIAGDNENGVFYGLQTLIQLLPVPDLKTKMKLARLTIPYVAIEDAPRFAYRGLHLDCGRHFWSVDFIKKYIDFIALHKLNYFHWHLTEDQGWRIEIKKYPKLTQVGAWRNGTIIGRYPGTGNDGIKYGGFYTQEQIKEIVTYAADRYITVVPEIEMPGHSSAAIAAYPELSCFPDKSTEYPKQCSWSGPTTGKHVQQTWGVFDDVFCAGKENTFKFLEDVMDEVLALFPSKYIHVGGDESPKTHWELCAACQQRIKDNKLKDEHELQSYFIQRMEKYLNNKGRTLIGWDEILEGGLAPNAVVMSWRGEQGGIDAARQNHDVIMTPGNPVYFDHSQSEMEDSVTIGGYNPIEKVYAYEPVPKELNEEQAKHVLGAQANMWTEYMKNTRKVEYMLFPRISALSEVLWSSKENKNWKNFQVRLIYQLLRYNAWNINYSNALFEPKTTIVPDPENNGVLWKITTKDSSQINIAQEVFPKTKEKGRPFIPGGELIKKSCTMIASYSPKMNANTIIQFKQKFSFNKATGKKIVLSNEPSKSYSGDGAFTLVNGVQNEKGLAKSNEFLGFLGSDCEAVIDFGKIQTISNIKVHCLQETGSWIWHPLTVEIQVSSDGNRYEFAGITDDFNTTIKGLEKGIMNINFTTTSSRFLKLIVKNRGEIPANEPGAGNKAWLFVDEIEVN